MKNKDYSQPTQMQVQSRTDLNKSSINRSSRVYLSIPTVQQLSYISSVKPDYDIDAYDPRIGPCREPYVFVIRKADDDKIIGTCGFYNRNDSTAEVGISIPFAEYRNHGYGKEALDILCLFMKNSAKLSSAFLKVVPTNKAAIHCYLKCGFKLWLTGKVEGRVMLFMLKYL